MDKGFGLLMILISLLVIMFLFLSGFYLIGGNNIPGKGNSASPIKKAEDMKIKYNERNKETIDYLDKEDK